jgi:hypothetical protein
MMVMLRRNITCLSMATTLSTAKLTGRAQITQQKEPQMSTQMQPTTVEQIMNHLNWSNEATEVLKKAQQAAHERAVRYGIQDVYKFNDKLGLCWLVDGGPKKQTYRSETAILARHAQKVANAINTDADRFNIAAVADAAERAQA